MNKDDRHNFTNQEYLTKQQYQNDSNLNARISLHKRFSTNKQDFKTWAFSQLSKLPKKSHLLELGCGPGDLWLENADKIPSQWEVVLSDLSPGMLENARLNLVDLPNNFQFKVIDVQEIPYADDNFDGVIANHMLYHVPKLEKALSEIHRVLKPGGILFAATNGKNHMLESRMLIKSVDPKANLFTESHYFGLENGYDLLKQFFPEVARFRYEDALEVTETQPLLDYILSTEHSSVIMENPQLVAEKIKLEIESKDAFQITKNAGIFVATKR